MHCSLPIQAFKKVLRIIAVVSVLAAPLIAAETPVTSEPRWLPFPATELELRGLAWFTENSPDLWRLPKSAKPEIPAAVWKRAVAPDGGRIRFSSTTSRLLVRVQTTSAPGKACHVDAYVDDQYAGSARITGIGPAELTLFDGKNRSPKNITLYLPNNSEIRLEAVGMDKDADVKSPPPFAAQAPIVCYGSSVLQGTGAAHPAKTYPAALARQLNLDFVNLGFGGAGKAEPAVVDLVNQLDASCYLFDLGKSYGDQGKEPFAKMLATIRAAHPKVPILCVTPIYSTKEPEEPAYREKSVRLRDMMREAVAERRLAGDKLTHVIGGLELFGVGDQHLFHDPQHPDDRGNELIARRLAGAVEKLVFGKE